MSTHMRSGVARVWLFTAFLAALALTTCLAVLAGVGTPATSLNVPWWAVAAGFALAEIFVIHVEIRRDAYSLSLGEVPLVIGLFFLSPVDLVLAQCVGGALALVLYRRQSAMKAAFNVSHLALEAAAAGLVFRTIVDVADPSHPLAWIAVFAATSITALIADACVYVAISLSEGRFERGTLFQGLVFTRVMQLTNTSLGLLAVQLLWVAPRAALLLLVPTAAVLLAYHAYNKQRKRHEALQFLHDTSRRLHEVNDLDAAVQVVLSQARAMFRAEVAELVYFPAGADLSRRWQVGPGDNVEVETDVELQPTEGVWARIAAEEQALLFARPIANERLAEYFGARGIEDAMVAPLKGELAADGGGVHGLMLVGNRLSDVATFDEEDLDLFTTLAHHADAALQNSRLMARLRVSLDDLQEMNRLKDEFVSVVSHELRTPLTVISGAVKTVRRPQADLSNEDHAALLESAERAADRLRGLVEQLLATARLEQASVASERHLLELGDVAEAVVAELEHGIGSRRLLIDLPARLPTVVGEASIVHRILSNLVDNALKYSDTDSIVTLEACVDQDEVVVSVRDQGSGIPPEAQELIFDRFFQQDSSSTRSVGGVGLGLYICRRLADEINGRVWLERSDDRGSVFSVALPVSVASRVVRASA